MAATRAPTESDPLLPASLQPAPAVYSIVGTWRAATAGNKTLMALGAISAAVAGWATASTFVLFGEALDAMARGTSVGTEQIIRAFIRLAALEFVATWGQFFAWSRVAVGHTRTLDTGLTSEEVEKHVTYVEGLGLAISQASLTVTAAAVAIKYGWDALLVFLAVAACAALASYGMYTLLFKRRSASKDTDASAKKPVDNTQRVDKQVAYTWRHARALQLLNATTTALSTITKLLQLPATSGSIMGFVLLGSVFLYSPALVALPYVSWRVETDPSCQTGPCDAAWRLVVVFTATYTGLGSARRAWSLVSKPDSKMASLATAMGEATALTESEKRDAIDWIRRTVAPFKPSLLATSSAFMLKAVADVLFAVSLAYGAAWVLTSPYSGHRIDGTRWMVTAAVAGAILMTGAMQEYGVYRNHKVGRQASDAVVLTVVEKRLRTGEAVGAKIDGEKLVADARMIGMATPSIVESQQAAVTTTCSVAVVVALLVDPLFTVAALVQQACDYVPYYLQMKRDKLIYQSLLPTSSSVGMVLDALLRSLIHIIARATYIALLTLQIHWIATGSSTLLSTLIVTWLLSTCFNVSHASQFGISSFTQPHALAAALRFRDFLNEPAPAVSKSIVKETTGRDGVLRLELTLDSGAVSVAVRSGELQLVEIESAEKTKQLTDSVIASVGQKQVVMVVDEDVTHVLDAVRDNIVVAKPAATAGEVDAVASAAGVSSEILESDCVLADWVALEADSLRSQVLVARALLKAPSVLLVEDVVRGSWLVDAVSLIRNHLRECKVIVFTGDSSRWKA